MLKSGRLSRLINIFRSSAYQLPLLNKPWYYRVFQIGADFITFSGSFSEYLLKIPGRFFKYLVTLTKKSTLLIDDLRFKTVRSLVWSRGRLGRPVIHFGVLILASAVFIVGGALQSNFVEAKPITPDLMPAASDMALGSNSAKTAEPTFRDAPIDYVVASGDSFSTIGNKFNVSVDSLLYANNLAGYSYLSVGQKLVIPPMSGLLVTVASGDTVSGLAAKYQVPPQAVVDVNYLDEPFTLRVGQKLMLPDGKIPLVPVPVLAVNPDALVPQAVGQVYNESFAYGYKGGEAKITGTSSFQWPTEHRYITQYFSSYHPALDIAIDSDILASDAGTVVRSGWWPNGFGNAIEIDHGNGYTTTYGHMSLLSVSVGETVSKGQVLGHMGNTGHSFGEHVHFMIKYNGVPVNPLQFF
ncbi:MAG: peptidoglycan DD-metalloendopeptidase family protein [candidate division WWE3 bacterium]|nr:peptidoglycan DD-metalloendopeptidase family protein [candidate division WWE3 bacterium]